jgi:Uncharacterized conserved protein
MLIHFRKTLDEIAEAQSKARALVPDATLSYSFLSVTEAGLYHITAELAKEALARGGEVGDDVYRRLLAERSKGELESAHVRKRLFPEIPTAMPYVCFYPMSKRRERGRTGTRSRWTSGAG